MARCEDYPCCGHTPGDPCPDRDRQGRVVIHCVECDKRMPRNSRSSICAKCQRRMIERERDGFYDSPADY